MTANTKQLQVMSQFLIYYEQCFRQLMYPFLKFGKSITFVIFGPVFHVVGGFIAQVIDSRCWCQFAESSMFVDGHFKGKTIAETSKVPDDDEDDEADDDVL